MEIKVRFPGNLRFFLALGCVGSKSNKDEIANLSCSSKVFSPKKAFLIILLIVHVFVFIAYCAKLAPKL